MDSMEKDKECTEEELFKKLFMSIALTFMFAGVTLGIGYLVKLYM
jgi:hypothetical protein